MATASGGLTCRGFVELVTDYLEGVLPAAERGLFESHLTMCPDCSVYFEQVRQTIRLLGELPRERMSSRAKTELLQTFRARKHRRE